MAIHSTPVFLPEESHGKRSLAGYSPWGHKQLDMIKWLIFLSFFTIWATREVQDRMLSVFYQHPEMGFLTQDQLCSEMPWRFKVMGKGVPCVAGAAGPRGQWLLTFLPHRKAWCGSGLEAEMLEIGRGNKPSCPKGNSPPLPPHFFFFFCETSWWALWPRGGRSLCHFCWHFPARGREISSILAWSDCRSRFLKGA